MKHVDHIKSEFHITEPVAFVLGDERFVITPPAVLLTVRAIETVEDELRPFTDNPVRTLKRARVVLRVAGRVLAITKPNGASSLSKTEPGNEWTLTLAAEVTRVRKDFRKHLLPFAKFIGTAENGTQFKV